MVSDDILIFLQYDGALIQYIGQSQRSPDHFGLPHAGLMRFGQETHSFNSGSYPLFHKLPC